MSPVHSTAAPFVARNLIKSCERFGPLQPTLIRINISEADAVTFRFANRELWHEQIMSEDEVMFNTLGSFLPQGIAAAEYSDGRIQLFRVV